MKSTFTKSALALFALSCFTIFSFAQWNPSSSVNTVVSTATGDQRNVDIISDGSGGAILAWVDYRASALQADIYVQHLNAQGVVQWTANGLSVCVQDSNQAAVAITSDGAGGVFLAWNDFRNGYRDVYAQSINASGTVRWAANGVAVCNKPYDQRTPKMVADGLGGVIVCWEDSSSLSNWDVYAQRLRADGSLAWAANGIAVCASANAQAGPRLTTDGSNGAIIVWQDKRNGVDNDVYAQRIDSNGAAQWTANGLYVVSTQYSQKNPKIKSDFAGGAYIVWQDGRVNGIDSSGIFAQRVNGSGVMQWTANGISICAATGGQSQVDMTTEGINGVVITWRDKRNGVDADIYAQMISPTGSAVWTTDGIAVVNAINDQANPSICGDGAGGVILCWEDLRNGGGVSTDIYTQRINATGQAVWAANGILVGSAASDQFAPKNITDGNGGSIYAWEDFRTQSNFDVYAHHLYADGNGVVSVANELNENSIRIYPNPAGSLVHFQFDANLTSQSHPVLSVYQSNGMRVYSNEVSGSMHTIETGTFPQGLYLFRLENEGGVINSGNFVVLHQN